MARLTASDINEGAGARRQADARGVPSEIMMPRVLLVVATILLSLIGLVVGFSASSIEAINLGNSVYSYVVKQAVLMVGGGLLAFLIARFLPYEKWLQGWCFPAAWLCIVALLLAVYFMGTSALGATRWIYFMGFSLQPSELAKIVFVIAAARIVYAYRNEFRDFRQTALVAFALVVLPLGFLFVTQSDMGTAIIVVMGVFAVMWVGEVPLKVLGPLFVVVVGIGALSLAGYRADRIAVWLDPWSDPYGLGRQSIRSLYALAEGGFFGVGIGNSREKFQYISEAENDFIFAIVGEELGMLGALAVVALFLVVLYAGLRIAHRAPDSFGAMMAGGLTVTLVVQAFLNIAVVTGLFPVTGKPLPFISSGGSSILASMLMVGLILSVSKGSNVLTPYERRRNDLNVIRVEHPARARASSATSDADSPGSKRRGAGKAAGRSFVRDTAFSLPGFAGKRRERRAEEDAAARADRRERAQRRARDSERGKR